VFWPLSTDPLFRLVGTFPFPTSDHRPVWIDVEATLTVAPKSGPGVTYRLQQVLVTSLSTGGSSGEDALTENLSLNFAAFEYTVDAETFAWDIATNS
jgi:hypothetical protein